MADNIVVNTGIFGGRPERGADVQETGRVAVKRLDEATAGKIRSIERANLAILCASLAASLYFRSMEITLGVAAGGAVVALNFRWLTRIMEKALFGAETMKASLIINFFLKISFLLGTLGLLMVYTGVNKLAVAAGTSTIILAVLLRGVTEMWTEN